MIVDTNVSLSRWPWRRLAGDDPAGLVTRLRRHGVTQAWADSFDGLLHRDMASVNARLAADCRAHGKGFLVPFGSVNPKLPDWQADVQSCQEEHHMPGIRLHPNYHGYTLKDPVFAELIALAAQRGLIVQLAVSMEDSRTQHPLMRVPAVDVSPLAELVAKTPRLRLLILNGNRILPEGQLKRLAEAGEVYFDFSRLERPGSLTGLLRDTSPSRVVFGSGFPLFYFESALLKVREAELPEVQTKGIFRDNAVRLLGR